MNETMNVGVKFTNGRAELFETCHKPIIDGGSLMFEHCSNFKKDFGIDIQWVKIYIPIDKVEFWFETKER